MKGNKGRNYVGCTPAAPASLQCAGKNMMLRLCTGADSISHRSW